MNASLDEQISQAFDKWDEADREFGKTRAVYEVACAQSQETGGPDPLELRETLLQLEQKCAAHFAELARLSEIRSK